MLNFDAIQDWGPLLTEALRGLIPDDASALVAAQRPEFMEDAMDIVLDKLATDRRAIIDMTVGWIGRHTVSAFHGSRLSEEEVTNVQTEGLKVLRASARIERLRRQLATHPRWTDIVDQLDEAVTAFGPGGRSGKREGEVHTTLSRAGLLRGFNHYLTHGSEFDQRVVQYLLGNDSLTILAAHGRPVLFHLAIPGQVALSAANPYRILHEEMDNLTRQFLRAWSWWLAHPEFCVASQEIDCGLIFYNDVPPNWIINASWLNDQDMVRASN